MMTDALAREAAGSPRLAGAAAFGRARVFERGVEVEFGGLFLVLDAEESGGLLASGRERATTTAMGWPL